MPLPLLGPLLPRLAPPPPIEQPGPDWTEPLALAPFDRLLWLDDRLRAAGFPAMSPWWRYELGRYYATGKRWLVARVGRGGGKSTTLTRVATSEALFTERQIPPGQRWIWPFISAALVDARRRILEIAAILRAVGVDVEPKQLHGYPTIEADDARGQPIAWIAMAGTIAAASGPSAIGATVDEEAKLRDKMSNANPARELIASLVQTFRARSGIRAIRCSSPYDDEGSHATSIREGDTEANHVGRIGAPFLAAAVAGLVDVARWEEQHGDRAAAERVRAYAGKLTVDSPNVPTWLANPTIAAVASRREVEALPSTALDGLSRCEFFLREIAATPLASARESKAERHRRVWEGFEEANRRMPKSAFHDPRLDAAPLVPFPDDPDRA